MGLLSMFGMSYFDQRNKANNNPLKFASKKANGGNVFEQFGNPFNAGDVADNALLRIGDSQSTRQSFQNRIDAPTNTFAPITTDSRQWNNLDARNFAPTYAISYGSGNASARGGGDVATGFSPSNQTPTFLGISPAISGGAPSVVQPSGAGGGVFTTANVIGLGLVAVGALWVLGRNKTKRRKK